MIVNFPYLRVFFVGIGGISMSGIAIYLKRHGYFVFGCDSFLSQKSVSFLESNGVNVVCDDSSLFAHLEYLKPDCIVFTNTVSNEHCAYKYAIKSNMKTFTRAELLGRILKDKKVIGVTGAHGKTSTTGMIAYILMRSGYSPTVFIGGFMQGIDSNVVCGDSDYAVVEADDAYRSFLTLTPFVSVVTTISFEHVEEYESLKDVENTFLKYVNQTKTNGIAIINADYRKMQKWALSIDTERVIFYGLSDSFNYYAKRLKLSPFSSIYDLYRNNKLVGRVYLPIPGEHHVNNSIAAIATADFLGIEIKEAISHLKIYSGVERRFHKIGKYNGTTVYDDYGHHPNEIKKMLSVISSLAKHKRGKAYVFFQPHKYTRTKAFWSEFIKIFSYEGIFKSFITDVYAAGDDYDPVYNSENLVSRLRENKIDSEYIPFDSKYRGLIRKLNEIECRLNSNDVILCLGAGTLDQFAKLIVN
jgi:UDP-N-acetylmuramate--alanine ligase